MYDRVGNYANCLGGYLRLAYSIGVRDFPCAERARGSFGHGVG